MQQQTNNPNKHRSVLVEFMKNRKHNKHRRNNGKKPIVSKSNRQQAEELKSPLMKKLHQHIKLRDKQKETIGDHPS